MNMQTAGAMTLPAAPVLTAEVPIVPSVPIVPTVPSPLLEIVEPGSVFPIPDLSFPAFDRVTPGSHRRGLPADTEASLRAEWQIASRLLALGLPDPKLKSGEPSRRPLPGEVGRWRPSERDLIPIYERLDPAVSVSSSTTRAAAWRAMRGAGVNIISRWIDGGGVDDDSGKPLSTQEYTQLWADITDDVRYARLHLVWVAPGEVRKGTLLECGMALAANIPVYQIGTCESFQQCDHSDASFRYHPLWRVAEDVWSALESWCDEFGRGD